MKIENAKMVRGEITVPPDKSITHRMIFFASLSSGKCEIENPLIADDTMKTIDLVKSTGVNVSFEGNRLNVEVKNVREPTSPMIS